MKKAGFFYGMISLILISAMMLTLFACGEEKNNQTNETTAEETTAEQIVWLDHLPDNLDFDGQTIRVCGGSFVAEISKEGVGKASYDSYTNVTERLNLKIEQTAIDGHVYADELRTIINSDIDQYDLVQGYGPLMQALAFENCMLDMSKDPDFSLINLDAPYWSKNFTNELNVADYVFWVYGESSTDLEKQFYTIYVNNNLLCTVTGEEKSPIYDIVRSGSWTLGKMTEIARQAYLDDGDGVRSANDRFGFGQQYDSFIDVVALCAGATYSTRDEANIPISNLSTETNISINEALYDLVTDQTTIRNDDGMSSQEHFIKGNLLFFAECSDQANYMRDMQDDWTMIPMPKLDENTEDYISTVHEMSRPYGIPITANSDVYAADFALLEAFSAEQYRLFRPAFFDSALKNKYSRDEDTKEMIDLIAQTVKTDFLMVYGRNTGANKIFTDNCYTTRDIASYLARKDKPINKSIEKLVSNLDKNQQ